MRTRHPANAPGDWFVDSACIDCSAARTVAPGLIVRGGEQSVFARQPVTAEERLMAWRARLLCPTASVRSERQGDAPAAAFPEELRPGIERLGYNARASWGAHSFLLRRGQGNVMVDAPRWTRAVVDALAARDGLAAILLTHRDDVADAGRYAAHFSANVWIHRADGDAAPFATHVLDGVEPQPIADDLVAIPVPGHTEGSTVYLYRHRWLFTGDSLAWSFERNDLIAFRDACWFSWRAQRKSLERLLDVPFEGVFAGHGGSHWLPAAEMRSRLIRLLRRMERQ